MKRTLDGKRGAAANRVSRQRGLKAPAGPRSGLREMELAALTDQLARQRTQMVEQQGAVSIARGQALDSQRRFAEMYEFIPIPYLMLSDLGVIVKINQRGLDLLGTERVWVVGRPLVAYVEPKDLRAILDGVYRCPTGQSTTVDVDLRTMQGSRQVQLVTRCEAGGFRNGGVFHVAIIDLTAMRQLEEQRRLAEQRQRRSEEAEQVARAANVAKDEFLAMLSHELRTPLTPILAAAESLTEYASLPQDVMAKLQIIRRNVRAEARLIDDLLDVARITRNKFDVVRHPMDLHRLLRHALDGWSEPLARGRLSLELRLEAEMHWIDGDPERLGQVFRNLLSNAVKFSEPGGRISVRTEAHDGRIRVTVADAGAGMTDKQLDALFKPFVRAEESSARRGLGLGLVISRAIVEAHGGALQVWSRGPGYGTTVRVEIDGIAAPASDEIPEAQAPAEIRTAKVLLVEDDPDSAEMLATLLVMAGFQVNIATSVREARSVADGCHIVVSDISLPDGTGHDLMRELRSARPTRGLALSGYSSQHDVANSLAAGFEEHLTKPVDLEQFVAAVRRLATQKA